MKKIGISLITIGCLVSFAISASGAVTLNSNGALAASFNVGTGSVSGDLVAVNNPDGLQITGTVGTWSNIWTGTPAATNNGVTLTFNGGADPIWGGTVGTSDGNGVGSQALRMGSFLSGATDISWVISGLTPNATYDMVWYNKKRAPTTPGGENRAPNTGVSGFDAGNGVGASAPWDSDRDQNFIGVQADGSGTISGTWFYAGGQNDITAVAGIQIVEVIPEPSTFALLSLSLMVLVRRRR